MAFAAKFLGSARELKKLHCIVLTGVLIALDIVLKLVSIKVTDNIKITFAYLALASIGALFGPTVGFIAGALTDVIGFIFSPEGGFNPLFTLVEATGGMIYGLFLYGLQPVKRQNKPGGEKKSLSVRIFVSVGAGLLVGAAFGGLSLIIGSFAGADPDSTFSKAAAVFSGEGVVIVAAIVGFLYGAFFTMLVMTAAGSELKISLGAVFSKVTVMVVCNLLMTPAAFILSGYMTFDSLLASYPLRLAKNLVQCPLDCILLITIIFPLLLAYEKEFSPGKRLNTKSLSKH